MLICKQWEKIISNSCLLETVHVSTLGGFSKLQAKLERAPYQRARVNRIIIVVPEFQYFDDAQDVLSLLPNIKMLYIDPYLSHRSSVEMPQQPFANSIEYLKVPMGEVIHYLKAAPNLTKLTLKRFETRIEQLEALHNLLPKLTHLEFQDVELFHGWHENPGLSPKINKAPLVESITITFQARLLPEYQTKWFKYMNKKYPNLKACHFGHLGEGVMTANVESKYVFADLFGLMGKGNCQVQNMRFSANWFSPKVDYSKISNQAKQIARLTLDDAEIPTFEFLKLFPCLKELAIYGKPSKRIITNLNQLLDAAPETLASLILDNTKIECEVTNLYPLRTLSISRSSVPEHLYVFLNQSLQQLNSLKLDSVHFKKKTVDLSLINLSYLEYRTYFQNSTSMDLMMLTFKNNEKRCWSVTHGFEEAETCNEYNTYEDTFSKYDAAAYSHMISSLHDTSKGKPPLTFVCASLKSILILVPLYCYIRLCFRK